jgi:DNA-binding PadR family transcriptional regulator
VREARDAGRPPRRNYELTGAGAEVLREALARHPDVRALFAPPHGRPGMPVPRPA